MNEILVFMRGRCPVDIKEKDIKWSRQGFRVYASANAFKKYPVSTNYVSDTVLDAEDIQVSQMGLFPIVPFSFFPSFPSSVLSAPINQEFQWILLLRTVQGIEAPENSKQMDNCEAMWEIAIVYRALSMGQAPWISSLSPHVTLWCRTIILI